MSIFEKIMKYIAVGTLIGAILLGISWRISHVDIMLTLTITFGVTFYHIAIRLLIGKIVDSIFHNQMNYNHRWFQAHRFEAPFYQKLKVKQWKNKIPTYSPASFSPKEHSWEEIVQASCQAEIVHEIIIVFCFLPLALIPIFDSIWAFLITSIISAMMDMPFVILQRYNRPRILRMIK